MSEKTKVKKQKRERPSTGQSAEPRELPFDSLNPLERRLVSFLDGDGAGPRSEHTIKDLVAKAGLHNKTGSDETSWVRNSLRRTVSCGWVEKTSPGHYRISEAGRRRIRRISAQAA